MGDTTIITEDREKPGVVYTLDEMRILERTGHPPTLPDRWRHEAERMYERERQLRDEMREVMRPEPTECNRCGACCLRFTLPWSPEKLRENFEAWLRGDRYVDEVLYKSDRVTVGGPCNRPVHAEAARWYPALIPIDPHEATRGMVFKEGIGLADHPYWYACRYVSVVGGCAHCYIHDSRPYTCRAFTPKSMGGYLAEPDMLYHPMCSYRRDHDWVSEEAWINYDSTRCLNKPIIRDGGLLYDHVGRTVIGDKHPADRTIIYKEID